MNTFDLLVNTAEATIVDRFDIPPTPERLSPPPDCYRHDRLRQWLKAMARGREHLWFHQSMALEALHSAMNVVLATGTGSGKSLVFQADMVRRLIDDPDATGFALYPAKALAATSWCAGVRPSATPALTRTPSSRSTATSPGPSAKRS